MNNPFGIMFASFMGKPHVFWIKDEDCWRAMEMNPYNRLYDEHYVLLFEGKEAPPLIELLFPRLK